MARARPLSPFLTIYGWYPTMASSIVHRVTGVGLALGTLLLAWWLIAVASGPEPYQVFRDVAASWLGQFILFGFTWALMFHLLNGIRHLAWDMGYGFTPAKANRNSWIVFILSVALAVGAFAVAYTGHGGYGA
ncbi:MAG TPA: succinate dehydrogenase, cytochrome b556 subunit [Rhizomicrobium sp.]|nr:succinate dehydrogenase, cytochrome b556 subunit [Rhizomicrobium sp.]